MWVGGQPPRVFYTFSPRRAATLLTGGAMAQPAAANCDPGHTQREIPNRFGLSYCIVHMCHLH